MSRADNSVYSCLSIGLFLIFLSNLSKNNVKSWVLRVTGAESIGFAQEYPSFNP